MPRSDTVIHDYVGDLSTVVLSAGERGNSSADAQEDPGSILNTVVEVVGDILEAFLTELETLTGGDPLLAAIGGGVALLVVIALTRGLLEVAIRLVMLGIGILVIVAVASRFGLLVGVPGMSWSGLCGSVFALTRSVSR